MPRVGSIRRSKWKIAVLLGVAGFSLLASGSHACSCAEPPPPREALQRSAAVFSGRVLRITGNREVWFTVDRTWKGAERGWVKLTATFTNCDYPFEKGGAYLVYATGSRSSTELHTSVCHRTKYLPHAGEDLAALGLGHAPRTPEPPPLPWDLPPSAAWVSFAGLMLVGLGIANRRSQRAKGRVA